MSFCYFFAMVDWVKQWEVHAPNFYEGKAHLSLADFGLEGYLPLLPGPGFGDFSHPTTQLVAQLMSELVRGRMVYDVGTGSGILALLAWKMGAVSVHGVEVSMESLAHARENVLLSKAPVHLHSSETFFELASGEVEDIALLNMIFSEQKEAYSMYPQCGHAKFLVTSGLLVDEVDGYIQWLQSLGRTPIVQKRGRGWCGFILV